MFNIEFISSVPELNEYGKPELLGQISCGHESDVFLASLSLWGREAYERQWREAARRLLDGADCSAFATSALLFWRPIWRVTDAIAVLDELLVPERLHVRGPAYDFMQAPYELIRAYSSESRSGEVISEWRVTLDDIAEYVQHS